MRLVSEECKPFDVGEMYSSCLNGRRWKLWDHRERGHLTGFTEITCLKKIISVSSQGNEALTDMVIQRNSHNATCKRWCLWHKLKAILINKDKLSILKLGFSLFFLFMSLIFISLFSHYVARRNPAPVLGVSIYWSQTIIAENHLVKTFDLSLLSDG